MPETTPLIKAALNLRVGAGFDVYANTYVCTGVHEQNCLAFGIPGMQHELFKDS